MSITFQSDRVHREFGQMLSGQQPDMLVPILAALNQYSLHLTLEPIQITHIFRTREEQAELVKLRNEQRDQAGMMLLPDDMRSVHEYWRGADISVRPYTVEQCHVLCSRINQRFRYGKGLYVAAVHQRGTAPHIHIQIPQAGAWQPLE